MKLTSLIVAGILGTVATSQGQDVQTVYQSDFTGTTLADAGLVNDGYIGTDWVLDDPSDRVVGLTPPAHSNSRATFYTSAAWQSDSGFTLDVTLNQISPSSVRFTFGIVDAAYTPTGQFDALGSGRVGAYGIGFAPDGSLTSPGAVSGLGAGESLIFSDGTGSGGDVAGAIKLSIDQGNITPNTDQTVSITVTPFGWSYSLNGAPATTGTFSTPFDTSRSYRFIAHGQTGSLGLDVYFSNITLTTDFAIPTLSEWGMIILVGLVVLVMGRRMLKKPPEAAVAAS